MPLTTLNLRADQVSDLTPLKGMPLTTLRLNDCPRINDLRPLQGMALTALCLRCPVTDLTPLKGMPLMSLELRSTKVSDLTPLEGMNLTALWFEPAKITKGLEVVRGMKSLTKINELTAAQFWQTWDEGMSKRVTGSE